MTAAWLLLTAILVAFAWMAAWARRNTITRYIAIVALPTAMILAWAALTVPLGAPGDCPKGKFAVLGARIDVPTESDPGAIYVLADSSPQPAYCRLPFSVKNATKLQEALSGEGGAMMDIGDGGEAAFYEQPVADGEPKTPERPAMQIGATN